MRVDIFSGSHKTLKVAKNLQLRCCWSVLFCISEEPTETNVQVKFRGIPFFKFHQNIIKIVLNITKICFKTYIINQLIKKGQKKTPKAITILKKEGGRRARYDHDHRFNGFFLPLPFTISWKTVVRCFLSSVYHRQQTNDHIYKITIR